MCFSLAWPRFRLFLLTLFMEEKGRGVLMGSHEILEQPAGFEHLYILVSCGLLLTSCARRNL